MYVLQVCTLKIFGGLKISEAILNINKIFALAIFEVHLLEAWAIRLYGIMVRTKFFSSNKNSLQVEKAAIKAFLNSRDHISYMTLQSNVSICI